MRPTATAWDTALRCGQRVGRLRAPRRRRLRAGALPPAPTSCSRASGPASPSGSASAPSDVPDTAVYCSITGFGDERTPPAARRPRRQLPRLGGRARGHRSRAAADPDRRPRGRSARSGHAGARRAPRTRAHGTRPTARRLHDAPLARPRRAPARRRAGPSACSRAGSRAIASTPTADGRHLTVGALEPKFFRRLCELVGRPELGDAPVRRRSGRARGRARDAIFAHPHARRLARSTSATRTSASGRSGRATRRPPSSDSHRRRRRRFRSARTRTPGASELGRAASPSAAGSASSVSIRSGSSRCSPSRSSRIARIPSARAPSMSSSYESPTITVSAGAASEHLERSDEDRRVRLDPPVRLRADHRIDVERVMRDELVEVALAVRDEPDLDPVPTQLVEHGQRVLVQREVLVPLPLAHHVRRARPRARSGRRPSRARSAR